MAFIWTVGYLWAIRAPILNDLFLAETLNGYIWACAVEPDHAYTNSLFIFVDFILLFCVPFVIILFCYSKVIRALNGARLNTLRMRSERKQTELLGHVKGIQMLIVVMILFTICYSLPYIFKLYIFFRNVNLLMSNFVEVEMWIYWVSYTNPWLNIFAYVIFRNDIRSGFRDLCGNKHKIAPSPAPTAESITVVALWHSASSSPTPSDHNEEELRHSPSRTVYTSHL